MGVRPQRGAVATGHPLVTDCAVSILEGGGNAFDAAVAAAFVSVVAEPALTSLGGGGFLLAKTHRGEELFFDFFVNVPGHGAKPPSCPDPLDPVTVRFANADQVFHVGPASIAVPGSLAGLAHVHRTLGVTPIAQIVQPAIDACEKGVSLNPYQGEFLGLLEPIMTRTDAGKSIYAANGSVARPGETLRNTDLAAFLRSIPSGGVDEFYRGSIARRTVASLGQGRLTDEDLDRYEVVQRAPLRVPYRGVEFHSCPAPVWGGALVGRCLESFASNPVPKEWGSAEHLVGMVEAMQSADRALSKGQLSFGGSSLGGTTHLSVADAEGNVASITNSNGEGSGVFAPGTGVMLNNMLGEEDLLPQGPHALPPGERVPSMMAPSILSEGGRVRLVFGSGGSTRIRSALFQTIVNIHDFALPLQEAVNAPRLHWDGEVVQAEPGFPSLTIDALRNRWPVNEWSGPSVYFGGVHAVDPEGDAASDPRRGGDARVLG